VDSQRNKELIETGLMLEERQLPTDVINERANSTLSFCAFFPSVVHQPSVFPNLIFSMAHRARWANEFLASANGVPGLIGPRDRDSYKDQCEERSSLLKSFLARMKRQPKRKPN